MAGNTLDKSFVEKSSWKPDIFKGKVAFITGGAGTICRVQAEALVLLGAKVAIIGRDVENTEKVAKEISQLADKDERGQDVALPIPGIDVRDFSLLQHAVKETVDRFGRIDFVIAGAAGNFIANFRNLSPNAFKSVVSIDLLGSFNTVKACYDELVKNKGSVIFVSATLHYYGVPFQSHVGAAKAGIDALSNALAVELGPLGVRSNCIAPGAIGGTEGMNRLTPKTFLDKSVERVPLQRLGSTQDIAETTVFLLSPEASYINGSILVVDGGMWHVGTTFAHDMYPGELTKSTKSKL